MELTVLLPIRDANRGALKTMGVVELVVQLGHRLVRTDFVVCKKLAAPFTLGCDYFDSFVLAISPKLKLVLLDDGTAVPIIRRMQKQRQMDAVNVLDGAGITAKLR